MHYILTIFFFFLAFYGMGADLTVDGYKAELVGKKSMPQKTLIVLADSRQNVLSRPEEFNPLAEALLAKRWLLVVLDIPATGDDKRQGEQGANFPVAVVSHWKKRMDQGEDVVGKYTRTLSALVDRLILERHSNPKYIHVYGKNAGAFLALKLQGTDSRVFSTVAISPMCDLSEVFKVYAIGGNAASPEIEQSFTLQSNAASLSGCNVRLYGGPSDRINLTQGAQNFISLLALDSKVKYVITPAINNTTPTGAVEAAAKYLLTRKD